MTPTIPEQQLDPEGVVDGPPVTAPAATDSASDNDTSEKSAREKFKKTSLASLTRPTADSSQPLADQARTSEPGNPIEVRSHKEDRLEGLQGKPVGKRALDDSDSPARENPVAHEGQPDISNGEARKRSREDRAKEHLKEEGRLQDTVGEPVPEEAGENAGGKEFDMTSDELPNTTVTTSLDDHETADISVQPKSEENSVLPDADEEPSKEDTVHSETQVPRAKEERKAEDHEMKDGVSSPRKKRSRDHMDTEADREQKIAATEEARAYRRSEELDRSEYSSHGSLPKRVTAAAIAPPTNDALEGNNADEVKSEAPPKATFGATNVLRPPTKPARSISPAEAEKNVNVVSKDTQTPANPSAFAASGFAALAASSTSPFGTLSGSAAAAAAPGPFAPAKAPAVESSEAKTSALPKANGGFKSFSKAPSSSFGSAQPSPFAATTSKSTGTFGGSVFGGGFGGGFGSGNKLTSFAAPTGDAKLGSSNGAVKPIGSPTHEIDNSDGSESDGEGTDDKCKDDDASEADDRFQHQDVETGEDGEESIFSSRAVLFAYKDNAWKEGGKGMFKLNVVVSTDNPANEQKTGRFIMRAHQTYRVLLNQTIFSQMKIGDRLGNEPSGKAFAFAVFEDGKPIPHMVKLADVSESKMLYHEVRKLQQGLV